MGKLIDIIATLLSIGAGVYLLSEHSASVAGVQGSSWLEVIAHGMGAYFVAKGLWMARSLHLQAETVDAGRAAAAAGRAAAEFHAYEHQDRTGRPATAE